MAGKDIKALFGDVLTSVCSWEMNLKDGVVWAYHILLVVIADDRYFDGQGSHKLESDVLVS